MCASENPREKIHKHLKRASEEVKEAAKTAREANDNRGADDLDGLAEKISTRRDHFSPQGGL